MRNRDSKLNMENGAFSPHLVWFERELSDLITCLDEARLEAHVALATTAPGGVVDNFHFEDPSVYSLLAYGVQGVLALESLHARSAKRTDTASWLAPAALATVTMGRADVAEDRVWLAHRYPHLTDAAFDRMNDRIRTTCDSAIAQGAAREALIRIATRIKNDPVRLGELIQRMTFLLGKDADGVQAWIVKAVLREREPFGLAFAKRHLADDLAEMLAPVTSEHPLCLAFFDMNGLKAINDTSGHAAGDLAIRTFLETVTQVVGTRGSVYRGEGGDEVLVAFPKMDIDAARDVVSGVLRELWTRVLPTGFPASRLTASCGLAAAENSSIKPDDLQTDADRQMYRAKSVARKSSERRSAIAVADRDVEVLTF
ncbi:diguanylate cyclase [Myxococcus faecalis]|uniref:GGDEF domain-containing protein n=1 Tax=Myxococcus faecalis TaxID=3115646 RepID=UPI0038D20CFC